MRGRLWLHYFISSIDDIDEPDEYSDKVWTDFVYDILDGIAKKMNCYVARRRLEKNEGEYSGEYLNIDAVFIDNAEYNVLEEEETKKYDPFVLPRALVELHNSYDIKEISYCLWKILCVRAPVGVLICYQKGTDKVITLKKHLEDVIWQGSLMKGADGDLLVIIGDDSASKEASWGEYFTVFEWRNDRLEKIEGLKW